MVAPSSVEQAASETDQPTENHLLVTLGEETYSIHGDSVREIARWREPLAVPGAVAALPGIISQRGVILPVIDVRALIGMSPTAPNRLTRYVICHHDEVNMALLVDTVSDFIAIESQSLTPVPSGLDPQRSRFLRAIFRRDDLPVVVLDISAIISTVRAGIGVQ
jgi:purine-binding chemotaxis protein CheW